jgi:multiple sugar transport system permease protein
MAQAAIKSRKEAKTKSTMKKILSYILLSLFGVSMIVPFLWMVSTSLKEPGDVFTYPPKWVPAPIIWENYPKAWNAVPFARGYMNSIFVAVTVTFGQVFTSSLAAYAFARLSFPGRDKLFLGYLGTMMIPGAVTMIPVFILLRKLGWIDTYKALIIPSMFSAYGTFMLRQFFMSLPTGPGRCCKDRRMQPVRDIYKDNTATLKTCIGNPYHLHVYGFVDELYVAINRDQ